MSLKPLILLLIATLLGIASIYINLYVFNDIEAVMAQNASSYRPTEVDEPSIQGHKVASNNVLHSKHATLKGSAKEQAELAAKIKASAACLGLTQPAEKYGFFPSFKLDSSTVYNNGAEYYVRYVNYGEREDFFGFRHNATLVCTTTLNAEVISAWIDEQRLI